MKPVKRVTRAGRRVTGREVAALAGVSRTTVSLVLNGKEAGHVGAATRARVQEAARTLGYVPDAAGRYLVSGRTRTVGLAVAEAHLRHDPFVAQVLAGAAAEARRAGFALMVDAVAEDGPSGLDGLIRARQVDALVALPGPGEHPGLMRALEDGVPLVVIGELPHARDACIGSDGREAAREAVRHLFRAGRRRVGHLALPPSGFGAAARKAGYLEAVEEHATGEPRVREASLSAAGGHRAMRALLASNPRLDAVLCASDATALGALAALRQAGRRVPDDVAVIGFDDLPGAGFAEPRLSSVRTGPMAQGRAAARRLLERLEGHAASTDDGPRARLVVRRSCGTGPRAQEPASPEPRSPMPPGSTRQVVDPSAGIGARASRSTRP